MNKPPIISIEDQTVSEGDTLELNLNNYAFDLNNDPLSFQKVSGVGEVQGHKYTYSPDYDASGTYQVKIKASDGKGGTAQDSFTIIVNDVNRPPLEPYSPTPLNEGTDVLLDTSLSWNCSDPDGDTLTYDIYFGTSNYPPIVSSDYPSTSYKPNELDGETTYYWKIKAKDGNGGEKTGPIWSFTTEQEENQPPTVTKISGPSGTIDESSSTFSWSGSDPDGSIDHYEYRKDGGSWINCGSSTSYEWSGYSEGSHTFE
ncbi:MAG TPA: hypothetical protein ENL41_01050, partial [candidate division WOR-3 bacterium]|nr:hypothetical protein [candidate division WOR-3 bacterium]